MKHQSQSPPGETPARTGQNARNGPGHARIGAVRWWEWLLVGIAGVLVLVGIYDLLQRKHTILRNFPVIGHLRYLLEGVGPEVRQYLIADNDADKPFNRRRAALGVRVGEAAEHGLRLRDGQRPRGRARTTWSSSTSRSRSRSRPSHPARSCAISSASAVRQGPGRRRGARARVPHAVGGQHLGHELRLDERRRGRVAQ